MLAVKELQHAAMLAACSSMQQQQQQKQRKKDPWEGPTKRRNRKK
jgi:hypothetical protein